MFKIDRAKKVGYATLLARITRHYVLESNELMEANEFSTHHVVNFQFGLTLLRRLTSIRIGVIFSLHMEAVGGIFIYLFAYLVNQQSDSPIALSFYCTMHLQRWQQFQCYLSSLVVNLVYWSVGRSKQLSSCYCGGLSCNFSFCFASSRVQATNWRYLALGLTFHSSCNLFLVLELTLLVS